MLGMMQNKGGPSTVQPQGGQAGGNAGLAALFRNNAPMASGGMPGQLPQIMAPQTPNIGMPPRRPMPQPAVATGPDAAAQHLKVLQDMALRNQLSDSRAGQMLDWDTNPHWVGTGGRNAR